MGYEDSVWCCCPGARLALSPTTTDQLVLVSKSSSLGVQGRSPGGQELKVSGGRALKLWSEIRLVRLKPEE